MFERLFFAFGKSAEVFRSHAFHAVKNIRTWHRTRKYSLHYWLTLLFTYVCRTRILFTLLNLVWYSKAVDHMLVVLNDDIVQHDRVLYFHFCSDGYVAANYWPADFTGNILESCTLVDETCFDHLLLEGFLYLWVGFLIQNEVWLHREHPTLF